MDAIHQFVHGRGSRKAQHVGVLLAVNHNGTVLITGSKVNLKRVEGKTPDRFSPKTALELAWDRQWKVISEGRPNRLASSMKDDLRRFEDRCRRYFKDAKAIVNPSTAMASETKGVKKVAMQDADAVSIAIAERIAKID